DKDILVYFDQEIVKEERMSFHPNTNDKTIFIQTTDLFTFLEQLGYEVNIIEL
ncbi:prolyl-tRNA synthetase associated domain-containing protein, partial [Streptococcus agalactiae]|nr:prolyl-tRNA synthetase associated domain-containing protein [Streptococcus agalactiae]MCC9873124.1 prolyl-tRNA synthetase associated domain-containing protein [Streptococcus agalactiae]